MTPRVLTNMLRRALCALLLLSLAVPRLAFAQSGGDQISFIRDAEIESNIRQWVTPIFKAAGLDPDAIRIYLVNDPRLNAFVAGGQNLFLHTGLLLRSQSPNQVIGVVAHETGHIAGGHLARAQEAMKNATIEMMIAMVLGGAAAAMAHGNGLGGAIAGGVGVGQRSYLQYSIEQEAKADQAALGFLDASHQSAKGLLEFFRIIQGEEFLSAARQDPYLQTHPLTDQRVDYVAQHVAHSPYSDVPDKPEFIEQHKRMVAKLTGFLNPAQGLAKYKESDPSPAARYARAIAYYRQPNIAKALPVIEGLVRDEPKNPYFREFQGQILFENGKIAEALAPYEEAVRLQPDSVLLRVSLAQVQVESESPELTKRAIANLNDAVRREPDNGAAWHFLAVAYGRGDDLGMSALALAEEGMANGDRKLALQQATRALQLLKAGTPARLRALDLQSLARRKDG
ncbi:MAG: peptidase [Rhodospirillales bacterium]|nr:peptidase [Rhodospirillales bacterium]